MSWNREEVREGYFEVSAQDGRPVFRFRRLPGGADGVPDAFLFRNPESIAYRFDSRGMREGDERSGRFLILSECGEYELFFHIKICGRENGVLQETSGLFSFVQLARED